MGLSGVCDCGISQEVSVEKMFEHDEDPDEMPYNVVFETLSGL